MGTIWLNNYGSAHVATISSILNNFVHVHFVHVYTRAFHMLNLYTSITILLLCSMKDSDTAFEYE